MAKESLELCCLSTSSGVPKEGFSTMMGVDYTHVMVEAFDALPL